MNVNKEILDEDWMEKARTELHETEANKHDGITALRKLISKNQMKKTRTDEAFLLRFLRARKYDVPLAGKMLERYETVKRTHPELYSMPRAAKNLAIFNCNAQMMLEGRDYNGAKIFLYRVGNLNLTKDTDDKVTNEQVFLSNILTLEWSLLDPKTQIAGVTVLADLEGFSLSTHASLLSPYYTRKSAEVIQDTFPLRFKGIHIVNQPGYFDAVYAVVKPFLKPKVKQRVYLHGKNFDELHKYLPPSVLPTEYGGQLPTADNKNWREQLFKDLPLILGETDGCEEETADSELKTNNLNLSTT